MEAVYLSRGEWMDKEIAEYMYNEILFSCNEHNETMKNIQNFAICDNMDGSWEHHTKGSKSRQGKTNTKWPHTICGSKKHNQWTNETQRYRVVTREGGYRVSKTDEGGSIVQRCMVIRLNHGDHLVCTNITWNTGSPSIKQKYAAVQQSQACCCWPGKAQAPHLQSEIQGHVGGVSIRGGARQLSRGAQRRKWREGGSPPRVLWMGGCGRFSFHAFQRREEQPQLLEGAETLKELLSGEESSLGLFKEPLLCSNNLRGVLFHFVAAVFIFKNNQSCLWCMEFFNVYPPSSQAHSQCG